MKKQILVLLLLMLAVYACKHDPLNLPVRKDPTPPDTIPSGTNGVCFTKDVLPIFQSYCAKSGCHDNITREGGYILDSYDNIIKKDFKPGNGADSKIYKVLNLTDPNDVMPPPGNLSLTQAQKDIIKKWIDEGGKNTACTTYCNPYLFTYSGFVQPLLQKNCTGCHSGATAPKGINLTDYNIVKGVALNGKLYGAITHSAGFVPMPNTSNKLSDCEISQIKKWIDAGAPQN